MKFLSKLSVDFFGVTSCVAIVSTFSMLLHAEFTSKIKISNVKKIGTITFKKKVAQRKYKGQVIWEDIEQNSPVYNNDSLRTSDLSEAIIHLQDKTKIIIEENSMLVLSQARNSININFNQGRISALRGKVADANLSKIFIKSKDATVSISKSDINLSNSINEGLDLTVNDGTADVNTKSGKKTLTKDEKIVVSKNKSKVTKISVKLLQPGINSYFVSRYKKKSIQFNWSPLPKFFSGKLQIARDKNFRRKIYQKNVSKNSAYAKIPEGVFYWRILARNKKQRRNEYSETRRVTLLKDRTVQLTSPASGSKITYSTSKPLVYFNWNKNNLASGYIIEIAKNKKFSKIIKTVHTGMTEIITKDLNKGRYYWRVKTKVVLPGSKYNGISNVAYFSIVEKKVNAAVKLDSPKHYSRFTAKVLNNSLFSWQPIIGSKHYELLIAKDSKFINTIII